MKAKKCEMCGAPLHGSKCEYCGTEYETEPNYFSDTNYLRSQLINSCNAASYSAIMMNMQSNMTSSLNDMLLQQCCCETLKR